MAVLRTCVHLVVRNVFFLVARLCAFPTYHGVALRREEGSCTCRQSESCGFFVYYDASCFALTGYCIAESYIVGAYSEYYVHLLPLGVGEGACKLVCLVVDVRLLDACLHVCRVDASAVLGIEGETFAEIADVGLESKRRLFEHACAVVVYSVYGFASFGTVDVHLELAVWT